MVIAECGINHFGDMEIAKELIRQAQWAGADLAKFQLYDVGRVFPDKKIIVGGRNWYHDVKSTQLTKEQAEMLLGYGRRVGIEVFFSIFDSERVRWCEEIGVGRYKIAFSQRYNRDLIDEIQKTDKPFVISSDKPMIYNTLYCVPKYPTSIGDIDFDTLEQCDGFSDHTIGLEATKKALERGARIIEKHFCLSRDREGCDISFSITVNELRELVKFAHER